MKYKHLLAVVVFSSAALILWMVSCGGGGGGGGRLLDGDITINIGNSGKGHELVAGETWSRAFSVNYNVSGLGGPFTSLSLNLQDSLAGIDFTPQALSAGFSEQAVALATTTGQMWFYVGRQEDYGTVCDSGEAYGPFNVTVNASSQLSTVSPPTTTATETTMDLINIGAYSFCVKVVSPISATVDLNSVEFNVAQCDEPPADIAGTWGGLYTCLSDCGNIIDDYVELTITQNSSNPSIATYTDSVANYDGTVCGNRFSFSGGSTNSSESGTFIMETANTATKTSTYRNYSGVCMGECSDVLTKIP